VQRSRHERTARDDERLAGYLAASRGYAGIHAVVGETGWQLSHGERTRVFLARALLQGAGTMILDESLAALAPDSLRQVVTLLQRRPESIMLIAHP
jgi:ABC-type transport system involved in cytochrome bd biosynthesis fused ATPase/permease subunit